MIVKRRLSVLAGISASSKPPREKRSRLEEKSAIQAILECNNLPQISTF